MSLYKYAKLAEELRSEIVTIELEIRLKIPPLIEFTPDIKRTITYFRSSVYPSLTIRSSRDYHIQTKELICKTNYKYQSKIHLSVEQTYNKDEFKFPLVQINKRTISRMRVSEDPITEITKHNDEYILEIEFNINNFSKVDDIIKKYHAIYFPLFKPKEISSINLARKMIRPDQWSISIKADGIHVLVLEKDNKRILLFDNGKTMSINNKVKRKMIDPKNVYEGELMENNKILYHDCLMYNSKNVMNLSYIERRKLIPKKKDIIIKPIFNVSNINDIELILYEVSPIKNDGFIITNINNKSLTYKSKFINTVDLRYKNGYLLLENEDISERISLNNKTDLENDKIYEFDMKMNLIRERPDKTIANYKMPYDDNPLYKVVNGIGIPSLRCFHNKVKRELLSMLPKTILLDIGSGKGGDMNKWIDLKFEKVYAVDPQINFRFHKRNIIEIQERAKNMPKFINYDSVAILFVPWDNSFIDIINKSRNVIMAIMDNYQEYNCEQFTCNINEDEIILKIPHTETAQEIIEKRHNFIQTFNDLEKMGWNIEKQDFYMNFGSRNEKILSLMYNYYYLSKC